MTYEELLDKALSKVSKKDIGERFEIPKVEILPQGNQTILRNFSDICAKLRRDEKHFLKFLSKELAAPAHIESNRAVFQRKLFANLLQRKIEDYVKKYVLCSECGKPDTNLVKDGRINLIKCESCGAKKTIS